MMIFWLFLLSFIHAMPTGLTDHPHSKVEQQLIWPKPDPISLQKGLLEFGFSPSDAESLAKSSLKDLPPFPKPIDDCSLWEYFHLLVTHTAKSVVLWSQSHPGIIQSIDFENSMEKLKKMNKRFLKNSNGGHFVKRMDAGDFSDPSSGSCKAITVEEVQEELETAVEAAQPRADRVRERQLDLEFQRLTRFMAAAAIYILFISIFTWDSMVKFVNANPTLSIAEIYIGFFGFLYAVYRIQKRYQLDMASTRNQTDSNDRSQDESPVSFYKKNQ